MKILYLSFNFEPDLGPCAFRNTSVVNELATFLSADDSIHVITSQPNRYKSFTAIAPAYEERITDGGRIIIERIPVPTHSNGFRDQIYSFQTYCWAAYQLAQKNKYDLVVASSSRLFTAFTGALLARRSFALGKGRVPLFLDIRDLFREAILDVLKNPLARLLLNPALKVVEQFTFSHANHINMVSEGFRPYFEAYAKATYSCLTNGIDDEFLSPFLLTVPSALQPDRSVLGRKYRTVRTILYAGNIGEGQGLHKIIPQAAHKLGSEYKFVIIGDGGARPKLESIIQSENIQNVELRKPVERSALLIEYQQADYLFVHLNDLEACKRVLPSKLFEYGATNKPVLAGVAGYAASFIRSHLTNSIVFDPGDAESLARQLRETPYYVEERKEFKAKFQRKAISREMARQILKTMHLHQVSAEL
ncbi:glycosyltransferase family 4 protein [Spirosoma sp.]|uniref:glycosyltransferase family 4 protein n=1 Tax=Spirosoma sp. TaxID=1899569 RepID=UPI003B3B7A6B